MSAEIIAFPLKPRPRTIVRRPYDDDYRSFEEQRNALLLAIFGPQQNDAPCDSEPDGAA